MLLMFYMFIMMMMMIAGTIIIILYQKNKFDKSQYHQESNKSFFEVVGNKGNTGEYQTTQILMKVVPEAKIVLNAYIPKDNGYSEIDIILITQAGLYVIENKNYSGWIFGNENSKNWCETFPNGEKHQFYNPVWQNRTHIKWLKKYLEEKNIKYGDIKSIICFNKNTTIKKLTCNTPVTDIYHLSNYISKTERRLSYDDMEKVYNAIKPCTIVGKEEKQNHIDPIKNYKK